MYILKNRPEKWVNSRSITHATEISHDGGRGGLQGPGLKITAGQRTMSGLIVGLTGQTLVWPVILTGHFWMLVA